MNFSGGNCQVPRNTGWGRRSGWPPGKEDARVLFYCTSGMSWKSALESSVPMDRAMKYVSTRLKKAFSVHGRTRTPRREARLIRETLRKPKPHTVEEQEQTRASITEGGGVLAAWGGRFGIQLRSGQTENSNPSVQTGVRLRLGAVGKPTNTAKLLSEEAYLFNGEAGENDRQVEKPGVK